MRCDAPGFQRRGRCIPARLGTRYQVAAPLGTSTNLPTSTRTSYLLLRTRRHEVPQPVLPPQLPRSETRARPSPCHQRRPRWRIRPLGRLQSPSSNRPLAAALPLMPAACPTLGACVCACVCIYMAGAVLVFCVGRPDQPQRPDQHTLPTGRGFYVVGVPLITVIFCCCSLFRLRRRRPRLLVVLLLWLGPAWPHLTQTVGISSRIDMI